MMDLSMTLTLAAQRRAIEQQRSIDDTQQRMRREQFAARQADQRARQRREQEDRQQEQKRQMQWRQLDVRKALQREQERTRAMDRQRRETFERQRQQQQQQQQQQRQLADLPKERGAVERARTHEDERHQRTDTKSLKEGTAATNEVGAATPPKHRMELKPSVPEEIRQMAEEEQRMQSARQLQQVMARAVASTRTNHQHQTIIRRPPGQASTAPLQSNRSRDGSQTIIRRPSGQAAPQQSERSRDGSQTIIRRPSGQSAPAAAPVQSAPAQKARDAPPAQPRTR